jgi:exonuclease VII small subunit
MTWTDKSYPDQYKILISCRNEEGGCIMANDENKPKHRFEATQEELGALYEKLRGEFSLEDLKAFEVGEKDIVPFSTLVADMEAAVRDKSKRHLG